jgi:hypothetical protein
MGNGIVHMQQVYVVVLYYIYQGAGKGCFVGREIKQWVSGHPHFMGIWNEWSFTSDYIVALKRELEAAGLGTQLVVADGLQHLA